MQLRDPRPVPTGHDAVKLRLRDHHPSARPRHVVGGDDAAVCPVPQSVDVPPRRTAAAAIGNSLQAGFSTFSCGRRPVPIICDPWADTTILADKMIMTIFAGIAEFERDLNRERTGAGRADAQERSPFRPAKK
jgi:hypothetical protein